MAASCGDEEMLTGISPQPRAALPPVLPPERGLQPHTPPSAKAAEPLKHNPYTAYYFPCFAIIQVHSQLYVTYFSRDIYLTHSPSL